MACGSGAWAPWTWPWAGLAVLGMRRLPGGRSKGRRGCRAHSPAEEGGPCAEWGSAGLGWGLPAPECPAQGHTLLLTGSWTRHRGASDGKGGVYQGPVGCGHSLGVLTCAHAAGKGLPSPASLPALQAAPNLRKPRGGLGSGEGAAGAETRRDKAKPKSAPSPQPAPPRLLIWSPGRLSQLLARGWVEKCDREIAVWGGRTGLDPAPGGGPAPPTRRNWPAPSRLHPGLVPRSGGSGGREGGLHGEGLPSALILQLCDIRTPPSLASISSSAPGVGLEGGGLCAGVVPARGGASQAPLARGAVGDAALSRVEGRSASPQQKSGFC